MTPEEEEEEEEGKEKLKAAVASAAATMATTKGLDDPSTSTTCKAVNRRRATRELRQIVRRLWPFHARRMLHLVLPSEDAYDGLTIGKLYTAKQLQENWRTYVEEKKMWRLAEKERMEKEREREREKKKKKGRPESGKSSNYRNKDNSESRLNGHVMVLREDEEEERCSA